MNVRDMDKQMDMVALAHKVCGMPAKGILQNCGTCALRMTARCWEYKQNNRRPMDLDWCAGWKERKED